MINELQVTLVELEKLAQQLNNKVFLSKQILYKKDYINELPEIKKRITILLDKLTSIKIDNSTQIIKVLAQLNIEYSNYVLRIEQIHDFIKVMIANYRDNKK